MTGLNHFYFTVKQLTLCIHDCYTLSMSISVMHEIPIQQISL
jgi:hypothetical protein